jgi:hypothetical protein
VPCGCRGQNKQAVENLKKKGVFVVEIDVTNDESVVTGVNETAAKMVASIY